ncbi:metal homeostatis protein bsd2 [Ceratobasidium sp. AG-Ba]|nr:metal homeostatis protein bsd2 [Ceratobasidium sp. AG-Ba]
MPRGYTALPVERVSPEEEMNAAFGSDDEDDDAHHPSAAQTPLLTHSRAQSQAQHPLADVAQPQPQTPVRAPATPGVYDFEYDYPPPPGSPPRPSALALPNAHGNSNGEIPSFAGVPNEPQQPFFKRVLGRVMPAQFGRAGYSRVAGSGPVGGGMQNDGVFGNVSAKPGGAAPVRGAQADGPNWTPEDQQKDGPPSYSVAQADAVPPYWETTIIAPSGSPGELIVDGLPTGSLFSFLWNLLVSMSFQFVGFLLTYLLHTTHAGKYGSRAGLGVTLIQYGFYLRAKGDDTDDPWGLGEDPRPSPPRPTFATAAEADKYYSTSPPPGFNSTAMMGNGTMSSGSDSDSITAANDWLSFFLMTIGWFVLLTSLMGYWRVKRWEHGVMRASAETAQSRQPTEEEVAHDAAILANIERVFGLVTSRADQMRQGMGIPAEWTEAPGAGRGSRV